MKVSRTPDNLARAPSSIARVERENRMISNSEIRTPTRRALALVSLAVAATLLACDDDLLAPTRDTEAPIQTDRLAYEMERIGDRLETSIEYSYTNTGSTPIFIQNCNGATGIRLEKRLDGVWTVVWANLIPACISQAIALLPGESLGGELPVDAGPPGSPSVDPRFTASGVEGIYRLVFAEVFEAQDGSGFATGERVPVDLRVSNRFALDD